MGFNLFKGFPYRRIELCHSCQHIVFSNKRIFDYKTILPAKLQGSANQNDTKRSLAESCLLCQSIRNELSREDEAKLTGDIILSWTTQEPGLFLIMEGERQLYAEVCSQRGMHLYFILLAVLTYI